MEVTNESRGWHLHAHWLVDARWVDQCELSRTWGRLVGQEYAIVKVIDLLKGERGTIGGERDLTHYERELMKYCVKGSALAKWPAQEIRDFVHAVRNQRFFFCFGDLFHRARKLRAQLEQSKPPIVCDCGCSHYVIHSDESRRRRRKRR